MKGSSGGMAATQTASRADAVAWIPMRWSKALDDAVAAPHQPAPSADERRSPSDQDGVPATAAPVCRVTLSHFLRNRKRWQRIARMGETDAATDTDCRRSRHVAPGAQDVPGTGP